MKKLAIVAFAISSLLISSLPSAKAEINEETFYPTVVQEPGWLGITTDVATDSALPSSLTAQKFYQYTSEPVGQKLALCTSLADPKCVSDEYTGYQFTAQFSQCKTAAEKDCIEKFEQIDGDGKVTPATYVRDANYSMPDPSWGSLTNGTFKGEPSIGLPDGHTPNIWKIGNQEFLISAGVYGNHGKGNARVNVFGVSAVIQPITQVTGNYNPPIMQIVDRVGAGQNRGWSSGDIRKGCQMSEYGNCALRQAFNVDNKYSVTLRLSSTPAGWLHGRINGVEVNLINGSDRTSSLTITGNPMKVPMVNGWVKWSNTPENVKSRYPAGYGGTSRVMSDFTTTDLSSRTLMVHSQIAGATAIEEMNAWLPVLSDKASNMKTYWEFGTIREEMPAEVRACDHKGGLIGTVGTNSAVYSSGPPTFDKSSGIMNYTVGAPHFDSNGEVFSGYYQLVLRSDVARCMYGFSNAPVSAKVEVASADGTPRIAVTSLNEKNGWLSLTATGYEFSTPKIAVKLQQTSAAPAKNLAKKITCFKGKVSKVVTTASCPSGYKKK